MSKPDSNEPDQHFAQANFEVRSEGDKSKKIVGYAAVFNQRSNNLGGETFKFYEIIEPGAFDSVLNNDVRAVVEHGGGLETLGRTKNGTLKIEQDEIGLRFEVEPPDTSAGRDIMELIKRGDISQASFKFRVGPGGDTWEDSEDGKVTTRTIHKGGISQLLDVSPVAFPAYEGSMIAARSLQAHQSDMKQRTRAEHEARERRLSLKERTMRLSR